MNQNHTPNSNLRRYNFFFVFYHVLILTFPPGQSGWGVATHTGAGHAEDVLGVDLRPSVYPEIVGISGGSTNTLVK